MGCNLEELLQERNNWPNTNFLNFEDSLSCGGCLVKICGICYYFRNVSF